MIYRYLSFLFLQSHRCAVGLASPFAPLLGLAYRFECDAMDADNDTRWNKRTDHPHKRFNLLRTDARPGVSVPIGSLDATYARADTRLALRDLKRRSARCRAGCMEWRLSDPHPPGAKHATISLETLSPEIVIGPMAVGILNPAT